MASKHPTRVVKIGERNEVVIPDEELDRLGVKAGDMITIRVERADEFPETDEPIGPEARAAIEAGLEDIRAGRMHGPFDSAEELIAHLRREPPESDTEEV